VAAVLAEETSGPAEILKEAGVSRDQCGIESDTSIKRLQFCTPTRPAAGQQDPSQPWVGPLHAQAKRSVLVEQRQLVTKGENLSPQDGTGPKLEAEKVKRASKRMQTIIAAR